MAQVVFCVPHVFSRRDSAYTVFLYSIFKEAPVLAATPSPDYAELYAISAFSFQHGASLPQELVARAKALGYW